ncbi:hypothetical protein R1flu_019063 [Riccia fluitans]|uniref:Ribosomal protein S14 n=1 Tax=Riccia fluitans TaxID=41844 RepID=A0ABD1ZHY6_9MARC
MIEPIRKERTCARFERPKEFVRNVQVLEDESARGESRFFFVSKSKGRTSRGIGLLSVARLSSISFAAYGSILINLNRLIEQSVKKLFCGGVLPTCCLPW